MQGREIWTSQDSWLQKKHSKTKQKLNEWNSVRSKCAVHRVERSAEETHIRSGTSLSWKNVREGTNSTSSDPTNLKENIFCAVSQRAEDTLCLSFWVQVTFLRMVISNTINLLATFITSFF